MRDPRCCWSADQRRSQGAGMTSVVITGGGTAGHTNPGIAVALALVDAGTSRSDIHFVGGVRGNEGELVPKAGFTIDLLDGRGILRSVSPASIRQNASSSLALAKSLGRAFTILRKRKPDVVMCLGGYAAFATSLAALVLRIPLVVSEQNARASAVNRLFGRFAKACALPYPSTDLPGGEVTGNPILPSVVAAISETDKESARSQLGIEPTGTVVAVWAGSLGARSINRATSELAELWQGRTDTTIYHVVGRRDWNMYKDNLLAVSDQGLSYKLVEYESRMALLLKAADVAVCRGGASTAAELAAAGLPSILVPLPGAPRDHQRANGVELVEAGGAVHLADDEVTSERLEQELARLLSDSSTLPDMADAARSVGRPNAAHAVAAILLREAGTK